MEITFVNSNNGSNMHLDTLPPVSEAFTSHVRYADSRSTLNGLATSLADLERLASRDGSRACFVVV
jgi:hypothetical protein